MFARSCGTLLSTPTLAMILKHNNMQHRLIAEETGLHTPVVMMRASVFLFLVLFGTFMNVMFTHEHGKLLKKAFILNSVSVHTLDVV